MGAGDGTVCSGCRATHHAVAPVAAAAKAMPMAVASTRVPATVASTGTPVPMISSAVGVRHSTNQ